MRTSTYIMDSHFVSFSERPSRPVRERFIKYYQDLYALHGETLSKETFYTGSQYTYAELGEAALGKFFVDGSLSQIDLLMVVTWSHEFDPDYASAGAYFSDKFMLKCKIFDVGDQGILSFFTSIDLLNKCICSAHFQKVMVLAMEQTTIPRDSFKKVSLPLQTAAFAFMLEGERTAASHVKKFRVELAGSLKDIANKSMQEIIDEIGMGSIFLQNTVKLVCKIESMLHRKSRLAAVNFPLLEVNAMSNSPGGLSLFFYLHNLIQDQNYSGFVLLFDEDTETSDVGYLLIRNTSHGNSI